jgi:hypothetical protein
MKLLLLFTSYFIADNIYTKLWIKNTNSDIDSSGHIISELTRFFENQQHREDQIRFNCSELYKHKESIIYNSYITQLVHKTQDIFHIYIMDSQEIKVTSYEELKTLSYVSKNKDKIFILDDYHFTLDKVGIIQNEMSCGYGNQQYCNGQSPEWTLQLGNIKLTITNITDLQN